MAPRSQKTKNITKPPRKVKSLWYTPRMSAGDWHTPPNLVSLLRGSIGLVVGCLGVYGWIRLALGNPPPELPMVWLQVAIVAGVISDKLDGVLARHFHWETALGKILERTMDGFFIVSAVIFETVYLHFPIFLLFLGAIILISGATVLLATRLVYKKWFIDDYVSTKVAPGYAYLLLVLHAVNFSYVFWFDLLAVLLGLFALSDFLWRHHRWLKANSRPKINSSLA